MWGLILAVTVMFACHGVHCLWKVGKGKHSQEEVPVDNAFAAVGSTIIVAVLLYALWKWV